MDTRNAAHKLLSSTVVRFGLTGAVGFLADASTLYLLMSRAQVPALPGRAVSFLCASIVTWLINRRFTFRGVDHESWVREWLRYLLASMTGAMANYAMFALVVLTIPSAPLVPTLAVAAGSIAGMSINYYLYRRHVFRGQLGRSTP